MRHLIILSEEDIKSLLEGEKIEVFKNTNTCWDEIVIMTEDTFTAEESQ